MQNGKILITAPTLGTHELVYGEHIVLGLVWGSLGHCHFCHHTYSSYSVLTTTLQGRDCSLHFAEEENEQFIHACKIISISVEVPDLSNAIKPGALPLYDVAF